MNKVNRQRLKEVQVLYRAPGMLPIINTIGQHELWEKHRLKANVSYERSTPEAEDKLLRGDCQFVFGCHTTPYVRRMRGDKLLYVASTSNISSRYLVRSQEVKDFKNLKGKKFLGARAGSHPELADRRFLRDAGIDLEAAGATRVYGGFDQMEQLNRIISGEADLTMIYPQYRVFAVRNNLIVSQKLTVEEVGQIVVLTTSDFVDKEENTVLNLLKALAEGVCYFKTHKEESINLLIEYPSDPSLSMDSEIAEDWYDSQCSRLESTLYPRPIAIHNSFQFNVENDHTLKVGDFNPMEAWDLHYVRLLNESGFVKNLYSSARSNRL